MKKTSKTLKLELTKETLKLLKQKLGVRAGMPPTPMTDDCCLEGTCGSLTI